MKLKQQPIGIGHNIKHYRTTLGLSQSQMTKQLQLSGIDITLDIYKKIEQNKYNLRINELLVMKQLLGVSFESLFAGYDYSHIQAIDPKKF